MKKLLTILSILLLALVLAGYIFYQSRNVLEGPEIMLSSPENGAVIADPYIAIAGVAQNISFISLNDLPISIDERGNFSEMILLAPGYNIITLYARDRFKKETTVTREVFVEAPIVEDDEHALDVVHATSSEEVE